ncbi:hypothetical protein A3844_29085 [Paenibacillus helianthi]|uniref:DUF4393 domain-containing protein n=1 Tax=Paenibacillus helianthi TaxID=1349432 RepID=A0ABX3EEQ5_9BACL|nr:hypothetical protein [Paenibacillus helianthi]OKP78243.1 hypothetical protein A3844_29085 [Paenibacillus helianthi]
MKRSFNIFELMKNEPMKKIVISVGEAGLDQAYDNGLIKSIPVLRTIADTLELIDSIRNRHLFIKLGLFFEELYNIPLEDRRRFIEKHTKNQKKLSQQILVYLDRQEAKEKAKILAKVFSAFLYEKIDSATFARLCSILDKVVIEDLNILTIEFLRQTGSTIEDNQQIWFLGTEYEHLVATGMVIENTGFGLNPGQVSMNYFGLEGEVYEYSQFHLTHLGIKLIKYGLLD